MDLRVYRSKQLGQLTNDTGVYALCDLDRIPLYVGQSVDGIRSRARRHLSSARSDIIANRQIDVWEIAYVWCWPLHDKSAIARLEAYLFHKFDAEKALLNGTTPEKIKNLDFSLPDKQVVQIIPENERVDRLNPVIRLPRQISQYLSLVDYILTVKDGDHLKRSLEAHLERLLSYHRSFLS